MSPCITIHSGSTHSMLCHNPHLQRNVRTKGKRCSVRELPVIFFLTFTMLTNTAKKTNTLSGDTLLNYFFLHQGFRQKKTVAAQNICCCNTDAPAILRVRFVIRNPTAVDPLHCTTVPFSLDAAVNVRVEVISARVPPWTVMGLAVFVKVATKSMLLHCGGETSLQFTLLPMGVLPNRNRIRALPLRNGSTIQSRVNPWLTVQM